MGRIEPHPHKLVAGQTPREFMWSNWWVARRPTEYAVQLNEVGSPKWRNWPEWRAGDNVNWVFASVFIVGTWSSTTGFGTGFTTSDHLVNGRWRFPIHRKVTVHVTAHELNFQDCMSMYVGCIWIFDLYLAGWEFGPTSGEWCNGVVKYVWFGLLDVQERFPVPGNLQCYIDIGMET